MRFRSSNPVISHVSKRETYVSTNAATYGGVITKSALLLGIMAIFALISAWRMFGEGEITTTTLVFTIASPIIALISVVVATRSVRLAPFFSIIYAVAQGTFVGFISGIYEVIYGNFIVATALLATVGVFAGMLFLFATGLVRVTDFMRRALFTMLMGLVITSLFLVIFGMFGAFDWGSEGMTTIIFGITIIAVIVASLYLLVDFDNIQKVVNSGADKSYEWVLSLGLLVTLVWLYLELLRLIAILRGRD